METPSDPGRSPATSPSVALIYFLLGFTLAGALTMALLIVLRPVLLADSPPVILRLAMFSPVVLGAVYGGRVAWMGRRYRLGLVAALRAALVPWRV